MLILNLYSRGNFFASVGLTSKTSDFQNQTDFHFMNQSLFGCLNTCTICAPMLSVDKSRCVNQP